MKTKEWIIKIISITAAAAAVCAVFGIKVKIAEKRSCEALAEKGSMLSDGIRLSAGRIKTLCGKLRYGADPFVCGELAGECKNLRGLILKADGSVTTEPLRAFLGECAEKLENEGFDKELDEKLIRTADALSQTGSASFAEFFEKSEHFSYADGKNTLSLDGIRFESKLKNDGKRKSDKQVSRIKAAQTAVSANGGFTRYENCAERAGGFAFYTDRSYAYVDRSGELLLQSRVKTQGRTKLSLSDAALSAEIKVKSITGADFHAKFIGAHFGIYYFVSKDKDKKITVGIDNTDGNAAYFNISSPVS